MAAIGSDTIPVYIDSNGRPQPTQEFALKSHKHAIEDVNNLQATLNLKAPLASPTFTGTPKTPTPTDSSDGKMVVNKEYLLARIKTTPCMVTGKSLSSIRVAPPKTKLPAGCMLQEFPYFNRSGIGYSGISCIIYTVQHDSFVSVTPKDASGVSDGCGYEVYLLDPEFNIKGGHFPQSAYFDNAEGDEIQATYVGNSYEWIAGSDIHTNICMACKAGTRILFLFTRIGFEVFSTTDTDGTIHSTNVSGLAKPEFEPDVKSTTLAKAKSEYLGYENVSWGFLIDELQLSGPNQ